MLLSVPLFNDSTYIDENNSYEIGLQIMSVFDTGSNDFNAMYESFVYNQVRIDNPLILASCKNITWEASSLDVSHTFYNFLQFTAFRQTEQQVVSDGANVDYVAVYDIRRYSKFTAGLSIGNTFFICFVLGGGALLFTHQCNDLVVMPIEKMI